MRTLQTSGEVIDALGGTAGLAATLKRSMTVVSNWRTANSFPANTYLALTGLLRAADATAPAHLWKMLPSDLPATVFSASEALRA